MISLHISRAKYAAVAALLLFLLPGIQPAASPSGGTHTAKPGPVKVYFFWGNGCPHCEREKEFLDALLKRHPELSVESYEVWQNRANAGFFSQMIKSAGMKSSGVPVTFIDSHVFVGFSEKEKSAIEAEVGKCLKQECIDPVERLNRPITQGPVKTVDLPFFGKIDPESISLPLITVILGGLDSFNPCAFFVLFFLLSLLVHARSRARMLIIGGTFVLFSGLIYFLFMAAWLNLFMLAGNLSMITVTAGVIALAVSLINIKDFFFLKKGISLTIPESAKPRLYEKMRALLKSSSLVSMVTGTVVLAITANAYELLCTAGFPMVFTRVLTLHNLPPFSYYFYLALYNMVYIIPLSVIVLLFTVTLGARKLTEQEGRRLKLISGLMMFFLGMALLLRPALLNNIGAAAGMLASALVISWIIIAIDRRRGFSGGHVSH